MAVARKTRSGEISSFGGLFEYAPGLAVLMTIFLFSLAGIPPLAGAWAKIFMFRAVLDAGTGWAVALGVVAAVNSVIALFYYANIARQMWMSPVPDGDRTPDQGADAAGHRPRDHASWWWSWSASTRSCSATSATWHR